MEPNIEREILERLVRLETKLDNYNGLREKLDFAANTANNCDKAIKELKVQVDTIEKDVMEIQLKPANNAEQYKVATFIAIVTAVVGFIVGKVF